MRRLLAVTIAMSTLAGCHAPRNDKPVVEEVRVRLAAVPGRPAAGYFKLIGSDKDDRLLRIDSAVVNKIELHEVGMTGGLMTMRQMADVPLPGRTTVEFAPGGSHAMLFGVDARITPGTAIPMLFTFKSGARIQVEARTIAAGDDMEAMHH